MRACRKGARRGVLCASLFPRCVMWTIAGGGGGGCILVGGRGASIRVCLLRVKPKWLLIFNTLSYYSRSLKRVVCDLARLGTREKRPKTQREASRPYEKDTPHQHLCTFCLMWTEAGWKREWIIFGERGQNIRGFASCG